MSLIGDLLDRALEPILAKIKSALGPFGKAFDLVGKFWTNLKTIGQRTRTLINTILSEIDAWRNFKENIAFRTRVISVGAAINHIQDFIDEVRAAWQSVIDIVAEIRSKLEPAGNPTEEAEQAIEDIEQSGIRDILAKFPKLLKGAEKILGFLAILIDAFESVSNVIDDLNRILTAAKDLRELVESGGPIFLSQTNKRRVEHLDDGTRVVFRVGNLHQ